MGRQLRRPCPAFLPRVLLQGQTRSENGSADSTLLLMLSSSIFRSRFSLRESLLHYAACAYKITSVNWVTCLWLGFPSRHWTMRHRHSFKSCSPAVSFFFDAIT